MIVHVINLDTLSLVDKYASPDRKKLILRDREERALSIIRQSKQQNFELKFWEGDTEDEVFPHKNIARVFKKIVQYAKEERLPFVTIAEDDMVFTSPNSWKHYIENVPDDYDLYLGGIYNGTLDGNRIIHGYSGHTLITVHERFYDFFLTNDPQQEHHLDVGLGRHAEKFKYIVTLPFVCKQSGNYSERAKRVPDYSMHEAPYTYLT